jgi:hypothetical protein
MSHLLGWHCRHTRVFQLWWNRSNGLNSRFPNGTGLHAACTHFFWQKLGHLSLSVSRYPNACAGESTSSVMARKADSCPYSLWFDRSLVSRWTRIDCGFSSCSHLCSHQIDWCWSEAREVDSWPWETSWHPVDHVAHSCTNSRHSSPLLQREASVHALMSMSSAVAPKEPWMTLYLSSHVRCSNTWWHSLSHLGRGV